MGEPAEARRRPGLHLGGRAWRLIIHRLLTVGATTWNQWYDVDAWGRPTKAYASTGASKPGTADVTYTYRPSGQVASRLFSGGGTAVPFKYTAREQLRQIGDPAVTTYPFSAAYTYHNNGTVSEAQFYSAGSPATNKRYKYLFPTTAYDAINRLKSADHESWNGSSWADPNPAYDLSGITYDKSSGAS